MVKTMNERHYEAARYAQSLDYSAGLYPDYHKALITNIYSHSVLPEEFAALASQADIDLEHPDATSKEPHPILWWNVDLPTHVLLAKDGEPGQDNYWAVTTQDEAMMQRLAEAFRAEEEKLRAQSIE